MRRQRWIAWLGAAASAIAGADAARAADHAVLVQGCCFSPAYLEIAPGDSVTWTLDGGTHTVTSGWSSAPADDPGALFDAPIDGAHPTFSYTFPDPGVVPYFCRPHEPSGMEGVVVVCGTSDTACRAGNVDTEGGGPPANVLTVDGSTGDPTFRAMVVDMSLNPVTITIVKPPAGGSGIYALWIYEGHPCEAVPEEILFKSKAGVQSLGTACRCLPTNNRVTPGECPCPIEFPVGFTSKSILGAGTAAAVCLHQDPADPRAPASFDVNFTKEGLFTVVGVIFDPNSGTTGPKSVSITNHVVLFVKH